MTKPSSGAGAVSPPPVLGSVVSPPEGWVSGVVVPGSSAVPPAPGSAVPGSASRDFVVVTGHAYAANA